MTDTSERNTKPLVSPTGHTLTRSVAFKFALDPTQEQANLFFMFAGASRFTFNHHAGRVRDNLAARTAEKIAGVEPVAMTPSFSWSKVSFINEMNGWKNGETDDSPINEDGSRGLVWRHEVSTDVFECASVDAAGALRNWSDSVKGARAGNGSGFIKFKSKHATTPSFRLRNRAKPGETGSVRFTGPTTMRLPKIGEVRVHGCTRRPRRMIESGRFHVYSATPTYRTGRWWVSVTGAAAEFHHERRSANNRHSQPVGVDLGLTSLAVTADAEGTHLQTFEGVRILRSAQDRLRAANQALARTKPGSKGHARAKARLNRLHAKVANQRRALTHHVSRELVLMAATLVLEDLNVAGMVKNHALALSISDAAWGELVRQVTYKAHWYGTEVVVADRWFASSKTCSSCGTVRETLSLAERTFACPCGLAVGRDLNAAINLARWPERSLSPPQPVAA
jgi:putative transposase